MNNNNKQDAKNKRRAKKKSKSALKQQKAKVKAAPKKEQPVDLNLGMDLAEGQVSDKVSVKDIHVPNFTMARPGGGSELLSETDIQLTYGRKYGLIGKNGFGKTTLLSTISKHKIPEIPKHLRILHIKQEMPAGGQSVLQTVLLSDKERMQLLEEEKRLLENQKAVGISEEDMDSTTKRLRLIYDRLEYIEASSAKARAAMILAGLEFSEETQRTSMESLSGGWRMRVSLACALFAEPDLLLLDEPTNHLDFPAVEWLKNYLIGYEKTLVVVSHDRKFLNDVCTDIIHIENKKLKYYRGDFDSFERVRKEQRKQAKTAFDRQQATIEHNQDFIRRFRANKKLASLAQSRIKILAGMEKLEDVKEDQKFRFQFPEPSALKKNELLLVDEMAFGYTPGDRSSLLYKGVNLRVKMGDVVGVFGKNGTGKSTLISLLMGKLTQLGGEIELNSQATIGYFAQHHGDMFDLSLTPYELLSKKFPKTQHQEIYRKLGQFKLADNCANKRISLLSGGEKSRLSFAILTWHNPHLLVMDEPTNHLDLDTIDGLAGAIREFEGAVILISHDEHFLSNVCKEFWSIGPNRTIKTFHSFAEGKEFSYSK